MGEKAQVVLSILVGILIFLIVFFIGDGLPPETQRDIGIVSAILCSLITYAIIKWLSLDPNIRSALKNHGSLGQQQKARIIMYILLSYPGDIEITLRVSVENWINLLIAGVNFAKKEWFTTYIISIDDWANFGEHAFEYNKSLKKRSDITKTRCIIQPQSIINSETCDSRLVKESKSAGIEVPVYSKEEISDIQRLQKLEDFALFDSLYLIAGKTSKKNLKLRNKVKITLKKGTTKVSKYNLWRNEFKSNEPRLKC